MEAPSRAMPNANGCNGGSPSEHLPPMLLLLLVMWVRCLKVLARVSANVSGNAIAAASDFQGSVEMIADLSYL